MNEVMTRDNSQCKGEAEDWGYHLTLDINFIQESNGLWEGRGTVFQKESVYCL